ncbi:hypothetical protein DL769_001248 [Monosporascus sp. CRB-8-3]|nr:hypothetical protein DL769_001248 [Monosporascus sp. CRB-8-3]
MCIKATLAYTNRINMPKYLVTGASRGIGFEFIRQLSEDPDSVVIGIVRDKEATEKRVQSELKRTNIHIIQGDLVSYESLTKAAEDTSKITGGSLDYLIANAGLVSYSGFSDVEELGENPEAFEKDLLDSFNVNAVGNIHLFNVFLPLIRQGNAKKVIAISSGMADVELIRLYDVVISAPYAISKAALNTAVAKFSARYRNEGILFMSISPGVVDTGHVSPANLSEQKKKRAMEMTAKFAKMAPHFKGPITPEESVRSVLAVIENASVDRGDGGSFVSHLGNKQWL